MNFFADECVYKVTTDALRAAGHNVTTTQEAKMTGYKNGEVFAWAVKNKKIFITNDLHFTNIIAYPPASHHGIIVLKMKPDIIKEMHKVLFGFLSTTSQQNMGKKLIIIDRNKFRVRTS